MLPPRSRPEDCPPAPPRYSQPCPLRPAPPRPVRLQTVLKYFPTALSVDDYMSRVEIALAGYGFTGDNSIAMSNLCRDESCMVSSWLRAASRRPPGGPGRPLPRQ